MKRLIQLSVGIALNATLFVGTNPAHAAPPQTYTCEALGQSGNDAKILLGGIDKRSSAKAWTSGIAAATKEAERRCGGPAAIYDFQFSIQNFTPEASHFHAFSYFQNLGYAKFCCVKKAN